jgi:serine/threonine-protein kinase RsbW
VNRAVELEIPARTDFLSVARLVVVAAASIDAAFGEERLDNLRLAVSEACANAMAAQPDDSTVAISIRCDFAANRLEVEVVDRGPGFDPDHVPQLPPVTDPRRLEHESGLGLTLIRALTDEAEIRSSPAGTAVRLVVYAAGGEPG